MVVLPDLPLASWRPLTANIEAGASQDAAVAGVAHQVVPRLLSGPVEVGQGEGQGGGVKHPGELRGQATPVEGPVETLGSGPRRVPVHRARGLQGGADEERGVLRADHCGV